ncbi:MAG: hypothetical protein KAS51_07285 [Candidatus Omnitrophica bacterium]|nr:hypothetical protein [Candidatus Omnitrophota bacterium]
MKKYKILCAVCLVVFIGVLAYKLIFTYVNETKILKQVVARLEAESRIAEVLVTKVKYDEKTGNMFTTIKFLEYDVNQNPLDPMYFTFSGNIIQFQSLVIRFDDRYIKVNDKLKGKSIFIFWKVFMLDGSNTQEFEISKINEIPQGYKIEGSNNYFEKKLWGNFWNYALNPKTAKTKGIKNVQIEAPGTIFVPGMLYRLKIEHDGGIRIETISLPEILKGEVII